MTFIYFIVAVLIGLLPALLIYFTGQAVANAPDDPLRRLKWALYWLEVAALATALASGLVLALGLKATARRVALAYLVTVPLLIVGAFSLGFALNPVTITEARLSRINQAILAYKGEIGVYPPD